MKRAVFLYIVFTLMVLSLSAVPYTTIGQLRAPDAYVLPNKSVEFTFTNYFRRVRSSFTENQDYHYYPMGMVNVGIFDRVGIAGWVGDELGFANLKLKLIEETATIPQLAIGVDNLFSPIKEDALEHPNSEYSQNPDKCFYERNSAYICLSKAGVLRNMTGLKLLETYVTVGVGLNEFKGQVDLARRFEGVFGSITVKPHKNISLTIENDGFNINAGAQYAIKKFAIKLSYVAIEEQENNRIGLAISYLFDKYADERRAQPWLTEEIYTRESELINPQLQGKEINTNQDLLEELKKLREQREQAQKVLDDLRQQLKDMEEETQND